MSKYNLSSAGLVEGNVVAEGRCVLSGVHYETAEMSFKSYMQWKCGDRCIQDALPTLSVDDREFLISGISPTGWVTMDEE